MIKEYKHYNIIKNIYNTNVVVVVVVVIVFSIQIIMYPKRYEAGEKLRNEIVYTWIRIQ